MDSDTAARVEPTFSSALDQCHAADTAVEPRCKMPGGGCVLDQATYLR